MSAISERVHDFNQSIKLGERGEKFVREWLTKRYGTDNVRDVRGDPKYRTVDIDFVVRNRSGTEVAVEVKTDQYTTHNIFYETVSAVETNSLGCMHKSKADYLAYYFINLEKLYIIELSEFNDWMRKQIAQGCTVAKLKQFKNKRYDGTTYTSQGYTLPLWYLEKNFCSKFMKIYDTETKELN